MISTIDEIEKIFGKLQDHQIKNALDLGCGKCGITKRLINIGAIVRGIDVRDVLFSNSNFKFVKQDARNFKFEERYDFIVCSLLLHFFSKEEAINLIKKMKDATLPNGINLLVCMSDKDELFKNKPDLFYTNLSLLNELYKGWRVITEVQDFTESENHDNLGEHRHNLIIFAVEKLSD